MALMATPTMAAQQAPQGVINQATGRPYGTTSNPNDINTIIGGMTDRTPWRWYDRFNKPLASPPTPCPQQINFFQVPQSGTDPITNTVKSYLDTNMDNPGQFNPPYCLVMDCIGFHIISTDVKADIDALFGSYWMEFRVLQKVFFQGPLWMYPGGYGFTGQNLTGSQQNWTNGLPAPGYTYRFGKFSRYIPPLTNFSLRLFCPSGTTPPTLTVNFSLYAYLEGLTDLPVQ